MVGLGLRRRSETIVGHPSCCRTQRWSSLDQLGERLCKIWPTRFSTIGGSTKAIHSYEESHGQAHLLNPTVWVSGSILHHGGQEKHGSA